MYDLRHMLYHHVHRQSLSFFEGRRTGDMVVRLDKRHRRRARISFRRLCLASCWTSSRCSGWSAVMVYLDWRFGPVALSIAPVLFVVVYRLTRRIKKAAREVKAQESELASIVQESISSVRVVKAFGAEDYEERRFDTESQQTVDVALRARSIKARLSPFVDIIVATGMCIALLWGVRLVLTGQLTSGALLVFVFYLGKMYKPMKDLSKTADTLSKAAVGFERIGELMEMESQVRNLPGAREAPAFNGRIEFDHVTFGYLRDHPVLERYQFHDRNGPSRRPGGTHRQR